MVYNYLKSINWCEINFFSNYQISERGHVWCVSQNKLININYTNWEPTVKLLKNNRIYTINLRKILYNHFNIKVEDFTWKQIPKFPTYLISEYGHVWSKKSNKLMKYQYDKDGYPRINIRDSKGDYKTEHIHTLVLESFISLRPNGKIARHYPDFDVDNNHYTNLSWGSFEENASDRVEHGHHHWNTRLNEKQIYEIINLVLTTNLTYKQIGEKFNVSQTYVSNVVNRDMWKTKCKEKLKSFTGRKSGNMTLETKSKIKTMIINGYNRKTILHHLNISTSVYERFTSSQEYNQIQPTININFLKNISIRTPKKLSNEEKLEIKRLRNENVSYEKLSKQFEVSPSTIRKNIYKW